MKRLISISIISILCLCTMTRAAYTSARDLLDKPHAWYRSDEATRIANNLLSYQSDLGGWPKNIDTAAEPYTADRAKLRSTFDNSATTDELRFIARMYVATRDERFRASFIKGLDYILKAQYPNGGWPQSSPVDRAGYSHYITFNDGTMPRLMMFIKDVIDEDRYSFVDHDRYHACLDAWTRGIDCILKCQITVDGKLTAWCAQHDDVDFSPRPARAFEPVSISGCESVGVVHVLMRVDHPTPQVIRAVDAAVVWLDSVKIPGIRTEDRPSQDSPRGFDRFVIEDPTAPPMWARFYEIGTNKPMFLDRDKVVHYQLSEIGIERRLGYRWLKYWPQDLIAKEYPAWKAKVSAAGSGG